jgi:hypothetical protein
MIALPLENRKIASELFAKKGDQLTKGNIQIGHKHRQPFLFKQKYMPTIKSKLLTIIICLLGFQKMQGQNNRINTNNTIGWYSYMGTFKVSSKVGIHSEYQWRRNNLITNWQQGLLRVGINYNLNPRVLLRLGYAWAETYPYGEYPLNGFGKEFTEHRIFEMIQLTQKEGIVDLSHRFMLEQRFVGRYSSAIETTEDEFPLLHRMRYMVRVQIPLKGTEIKDKTPYVAIYDEVFVGFGKNVSANVFDQNRIGVLVGYRFNKNIRMEGGYLNQTLQYGRKINGQNVFQNNNGFIISANFNFDMTKKI